MKAFTSRSLSMALACLVAVLAGPGFALAKTEIQLWHGMTGVLGETLEAQAKQFNDSQDEFVVKPVSKGSEAETLAAAMAAYQQKNPPHLVQVVQAATQTMMLSGAAYPLFELLQQNGIKVDGERFHQAGGRSLWQGRQAVRAAVQRRDADPLLQQGRLQEGGARPREAAPHLADGGGATPRSCWPPAPSAGSRPGGPPGRWSRTCTPSTTSPSRPRTTGWARWRVSSC